MQKLSLSRSASWLHILSHASAVLGIVLLLQGWAPCQSASAQADSTAQLRGTWTVLPILFSAPETGFGIGVLPQYVFRSAPRTRTSNVRMDAYYTQESQFNVTARTSIWLPGNRHRLRGTVQLREWPTSFYGIGNTFADSLTERYTERSLSASGDVHQQLRPGLYAGMGLDISHRVMQDREPDGQLADGAIAGSIGGQTIGLGAFLVLDTRDEVFYPTQGTLIRLGSRLYGRMMGADFGFTQHHLDARRYLRLFGSHVLVLQGTLRLSTGTPPFQMLPGVGEVVRGYPSMRYADRHLLAVQAEYRIVPLVWRFGVAVFAGAGQVAPALGDVAWRRFHVAYGAGLRVQIIRSEGINVRWDFGFGTNSSGDYLDLNEAF